MGLLDLIRKQFLPTDRHSSGLVLSSWANPSERNIEGYLRTYSELYSVFGIFNRIATGVGEIKWRLFKGNERSERSQVDEHPILALLDKANDFQTGQEIIELTQLILDLAGSVYWYLPRNTLGSPGEIWVVPPHWMKIIKGDKLFIAGYLYTGGKESIPLSLSEVIRFMLPDPLNPYGGIGYVQPSAVEIDSEIYAGKWNRNFFYNSARPDGALETEETLTKEQFEELRDQWQGRHGGLNESHKLAILQGGLKYKQIQVSQKDMDFAALRKQTRENQLFAVGMPLSVMGIVENVNRANAEAGDYTFARWLIKPRANRLKNKLNEQLIPMFSGSKGLQLDFDEVVPATIEQKQLLAESGVRSGWMTVNEARKLNGFDPIEGGEILLVPLNLIPTPTSSDISEQIPQSVEEPKSKGQEERKEAIWRLYAQKTERIEGQFIKILRSLWQNQESEVIRNLPQIQIVPNVLIFDEAKNDKIFSSKLEPIIQLSWEQGFEGTKQLNPDTMEWIKNHSLLLAKEVNSTTLKLLRRVLAVGMNLGESIPKLATRIRAVYDDANKSRSLMIARTEVITASAKGAEQGYKEAGVEKLEWFVAQDERTCGECMALNGNIYPIGQGERPALHPYCRCIMLPVVV